MRLVCPNCGAQYEVPDEVIPQGGRDVQCSNCGDTWFQAHPDNDPQLAEELGETVATEIVSEPENETDTDASTPQAEPDPGALAEAPGEGVEEHWPEDPDAPEPNDVDDRTTPPVQPPRQREIDPSVADVLREEAAREAEARKSEAETLENQPELGLSDPDDEAARRQREAENRMALMRGETPAAATATAAAAATGSRRDVLPDIDEINSTLRKDTERRKTASEVAASREAQPRPGGFRRGFLIVILLAVVLILLYVFAPQISEAVPALAPMMESYVLAVNEARIWLDTQVRGLMGSLDGLASEGTGVEGDTPSE